MLTLTQTKHQSSNKTSFQNPCIANIGKIYILYQNLGSYILPFDFMLQLTITFASSIVFNRNFIASITGFLDTGEMKLISFFNFAFYRKTHIFKDTLVAIGFPV